MEFNSILLDYCWCCEARTGLHEHHVVPRAYGGIDGPTVTVCGMCHTTVHTAALSAPAKWDALLPEKARDKYVTLVNIIYQARMRTKGQENKPLTIQQTFTVERSKKIRQLKQLLGVSSIAAVLDRCIDIVHNQSTPIKTKR